MPIVNGKYQNPGWNDNAPPPIDADELNDISDTLEKLDAGDGAGELVSTLVTLTSSGWAGKRQTVTVPGVSANEGAQLITAVPTVANQSAYYDAAIRMISQSANSITFTADTVPTGNLSVYIVIQEVA